MHVIAELRMGDSTPGLFLYFYARNCRGLAPLFVCRDSHTVSRGDAGSDRGVACGAWLCDTGTDGAQLCPICIPQRACGVP